MHAQLIPFFFFFFFLETIHSNSKRATFTCTRRIVSAILSFLSSAKNRRNFTRDRHVPRSLFSRRFHECYAPSRYNVHFRLRGINVSIEIEILSAIYARSRSSRMRFLSRSILSRYNENNRGIVSGKFYSITMNDESERIIWTR